jgi:hypothetical protein
MTKKLPGNVTIEGNVVMLGTYRANVQIGKNDRCLWGEAS